MVDRLDKFHILDREVGVDCLETQLGLVPNFEECLARNLREMEAGHKEFVEIQVLGELCMEAAEIHRNLVDRSMEEMHSDSFHV